MQEKKNKNQRYFSVNWEQFHRDSRVLAWRLLETKKKWERIIAVARGGLVPAAIIARELDIRYIDTICISSYSLKSQREMSILKSITELKDRGKKYLIIDDLVDTGKTGKAVRDMIPGAYFANMYNSREQVNKDLHDGLQLVSEMVGDGYRPKSVIAGFLSAEVCDETSDCMSVCSGALL